MALKVTELLPGDDSSFDKLVRIYQAAIEPSEQKSVQEMQEMRGDARYMLLVATEGETIIGFSIAFFPAGAKFWLLEYMAMDRFVRSKGYGAQLFSETGRLAAARLPRGLCVLEVDQPDHRLPATDDKVRRLRFYARLGCLALQPLDYILPIDRAGAPPPMLIMVKGPVSGTNYSRDYVLHLLSTIYRDVYRVPETDRRYVTMVSGIPAILSAVAVQ